MQGNPPSAPGGPDTSISGQPGQGGGQGQGRAVQGRVSDANGKPLEGVLVTPKSTDNPPKEIPEIAIHTDEQGLYAWSLAPGRYTITFAQDGYTTNVQPVEIIAGQSTTLDVILQHQ